MLTSNSDHTKPRSCKVYSVLNVLGTCPTSLHVRNQPRQAIVESVSSSSASHSRLKHLGGMPDFYIHQCGPDSPQLCKSQTSQSIITMLFVRQKSIAYDPRRKIALLANSHSPAYGVVSPIFGACLASSID